MYACDQKVQNSDLSWVVDVFYPSGLVCVCARVCAGCQTPVTSVPVTVTTKPIPTMMGLGINVVRNSWRSPLVLY
jgi:hypothetical protein